MKKTQIRNSLLLLLTATIWGTAFVAQSVGMEYVEAFTFTFARSIVGGIVLIPCIWFLRWLKGREKAASVGVVQSAGTMELCGATQSSGVAESQGMASRGVMCAKRPLVTKVEWIGGICCGLALCAASNFQQIGIAYTTVGKAGFITALYVVIVPIMGLFFKKRVSFIVWICVVLSVIGLYLLCMTEGSLTLAYGDLLVLICAILFSVHIMVIDYFSPQGDGVVMSCIQFFVCGIVSGIIMLFVETPSVENVMAAAMPILYAGVLSSGVAYTLQIVGQKDMNPTVASLILCLESVVSALAGWLILHEALTARELIGCVLMFAAIVLAQVPMPGRKK